MKYETSYGHCWPLTSEKKYVINVGQKTVGVHRFVKNVVFQFHCSNDGSKKYRLFCQFSYQKLNS